MPPSRERDSPGGEITAMAGILLRSGFGVKGKALQDIVVELLCGKGRRKMAAGKCRERALRISR